MEALVLKRSVRSSLDSNVHPSLAHLMISKRHTVTGHARLAGDTSRDEDDLSALEGGLDTTVDIGLVASNLKIQAINLSCPSLFQC